MNSLTEYSIALICNHSFYEYLDYFTYNLINNEIKFKNIFIGDAGLNEDEKNSLSKRLSKNNLEIVNLNEKVYNNKIDGKGKEYQNIISI